MLKLTLLAGVALGLFSGAALAADMGDGSGAPAAPSWDGFYAGLNGGYGASSLSDGNTTFPDVALYGAFAGGQAGYNFVLMDGVVAGIQGDLDWAWESGHYGPATIWNFTSATLTDNVTWTGALTGHVGVTMGPLMLYGLAGVAGAKSKLENAGIDLGPVESDVTQTHIGWVAGGGVSALLGPFSTFLEYRYADYGTRDYSAAVGSQPVRLSEQSVRVGFDYHMH